MDLLLTYLQWIIPLCATIILLSTLLAKHKTTKNLPPGPSPLPIFGNLLKLLPYTTKPHKCFAMLAKIHGPIMTLHLGSITAIVLSSSTLAKQVLLKNHQVSSTLYDLDAVRAHEHDIFSIGPLSATSPKWKILRKIYSTQLLSEKMLEAMQNHRQLMLEKLVCYLKECSLANVSVDIGQEVYDASFNMMCSTLFSLDLSSNQKIKEIKDVMNSIIKEIGRPNIVDCYPFLKLIDPQRIRHRLTSYCVKLFELFDEILEDRVKIREGQAKGLRSYKDLLDVILDVMEEQSDEIKREHIHHLLLDLLGAGMDTTSKTIEWAMAELLRNPKVLRKLQEEIKQVVGEGKTTTILESDVVQLPYLQAIVTETLRLHPSAPLLLPRKLEQDLNVNDDYFLPKDAMLIVNAWAIGRDPDTWADPDSFSPERFLVSDLDVKSQVIKLFTFGAGKKICPGMPLALRISYLVVANLINNFNWKLDDNSHNNNSSDKNLDMEDVYGITIKKAKSLRAIPLARS